MANPNKVQLSGYTGLQAGFIRNSANENFLTTGAVLGGEARYKGIFARAKVLGGTAVGAEAQVGYEFNLGRNTGLELSAKGQMYKNMVNVFGSETKTSNYDRHDLTTIHNEDQTTTIDGSFSDNYSESWNYGMQQVGLRAQLNFGSEKARFGVGVEAGTRNSLRPNISYTLHDHHAVDLNQGGETVNVNDIINKVSIKIDNGAEFVVTPVITANLELGKGVSLNANTDVLSQGNVGISWTF